MQRQPVYAGKWVLAKGIELVVYPMVCEDLGWPMRSWMGKKEVAAYLAKLCPRRRNTFASRSAGRPAACSTTSSRIRRRLRSFRCRADPRKPTGTKPMRNNAYA
jgi:hypothetical protein